MQVSFEIRERQGIIVWVYTLRQVKNLKRFGYIHYVSNRMKYLVLYVDKAEVEKTVERLESLHYVRKVEISHRPEIDMTFQNALPSKKQGTTGQDEEKSYNPFEEKTYSF